jgi:nucleosome binding factor SPN SPT16 subunit
MTEEVILNPPKIDIKLKPENVDIAYPPLFQSGGKFDLRLNATTDDQALHGGELIRGRSHLVVGVVQSFVCRTGG